MPTRIHTLVIGAGQAGLATSRHLTEHGIEHVVLEKDRIGERWRSQRWDSFTLVTPNWMLNLPGFDHDGDPDGFLARDEIVGYLEAYAASFSPPLRLGVRVESVRPAPDGTLTVETDQGDYQARNVVVAVGTFQRPRIPRAAADLDPSVLQLHSSRYRAPEALPGGGVLVVGSGQSGAQIADELHEAGRRVFLAVGSAGRAPRRYRGRDFTRWADTIGFFARTPDQLPSPAARFAANPVASGKDGGKNLNLHAFARDGVVLLGRYEDAEGSTMRFASTLHETLAQIDAGVTELKESVDRAIAEMDLDVPPADPAEDPELRDGYDLPARRELDLRREGIGTVIWACGYRFDFSWVEGPAYDGFGYPVADRGVTTHPGIYFVGLHFLHTAKSGLFYGVGDDAAHVVAALARR